MRQHLRDAATAMLLAIAAVLLGAGAAVVWACVNPAQAQVPAAANAHKRTLLRAAQAEWGLGAPVAVFAAQVHQESGWRPEAVSQVGARGLAQFMPATARWWCERGRIAAAGRSAGPPQARPALSGGSATGEAVERGGQDCQPHNPAWALRALVGYDKYLFDRTPERYGARDRMWVALRAYNGGLGHWQREAQATGLALPTRAQVDGACGLARRAALHCAENLGYPRRILIEIQPRYASWGPGL